MASVTVEAIRAALLEMIARQKEIEEELLVSSTKRNAIESVQKQTKLLETTFRLYNRVL